MIPVTIQSAFAHHQAGRLQEAEREYREILATNPNHSDALYLLVALEGQAGRPLAAVEFISRAIALNPSSFQYHNALAVFFLQLNRTEEAVKSFEQGIALRPNDVEALCNLGNVFCRLRQFDRAIAPYQSALLLNDNLPDIHSDLGLALGHLARYEEAAKEFQRAIELDPNHAKAHANLGANLLLRGDFEHGWPELEWRWKVREYSARRSDFPQPPWNGSPLDGKTILLRREQGFGDTIHFVRYAPMVAAAGGRVILSCRAELVRLLSRVEGVELAGENVPANFDVHCSLMSLPHIFKTRLDSIPAKIPYIHPDQALVSQWRNKLKGTGPRPKIGIAWQGSPTHTRDRVRSVHLSDLSPIFKAKDADFYSLQKGPAAAEAAEAGLIDLTAELNDFADTAALISQLDLVISVDTSIVHLAGAMGKPVWILLPLVPDFRWMLEREDSPWYPTAQLFRQKKIGDWAQVIDRVAAAIASHNKSARAIDG